MRLRCYLPSTSAIMVIVVVAILILHNTASHTFAAAGLATMMVMATGAIGLVAGTIVVSAVTIRRRRAAAGACHTCSHPCREAMVPLPEFDAPLWPHRPLSRPSLPITVLPVTVPPATAPPATALPVATVPQQRITPQAERVTENREPVRA